MRLKLAPLNQCPNRRSQKHRFIDIPQNIKTHDPNSIRHIGAGEYCLVKHDSFKMSNGKWFWWSRDFGGHSVLDYLIKVQGMGFVDAVLSLSGGVMIAIDNSSVMDNSAVMGNSTIDDEMPPKATKSPPPKPFKPPKPSTNNNRVYAYLRGRGISKDIISQCIKTGIVYESKYLNPREC